MSRISKLAQKIARGQVVELIDRSREILSKVGERKHYLTTRSLFRPDFCHSVFIKPFLDDYVTGREPAFDRALLNQHPAMFYPGFSHTQQLKEYLASHDSREIHRILDAADAVLQNRFPIFTNGFLSYGNPPQWNWDPLVGREAPKGFYADIKYLDAVSVGDSKVVWEISRLQFVFDLGQAYILTGDDKYPQKFFQLIHSWNESHRDYQGIAFCSALEFAFRINSLIWGIFFFKQSPSLTQEFARDIYRLIYVSATFIEKHLSRYFAPNTHLLGEAWGLYIAGLFFPEFRDAKRWCRIGKKILTKELEKQFTSDGMHAELSVAYHGYALEFILSATILSERLGFPLPRPFYDRIHQMTDVLVALQRPDGTWPNIGDQDGGRLHFLSRVPALDFGPLLEAARLFADKSTRKSCAGLYVESFWFIGAEPKPIAGNKKAESRSHFFPSSGLAVSGSRNNMFSAFQCGPFGYKDSPHSHADMLHLDVSIGRDNFLIDPGTYVYTSDLQMRNNYRSPQRHNGPALEEVQLFDPDDPFGWIQKPDCTVSQCYMGNRSDYVAASYKLRHPRVGLANVARSVLFVHDSFWVVRDQIDLSLACRSLWQFITPCQITQMEDFSILQGSSGALAIVPGFSSQAAASISVTETSFSEDYLHSRSGSALHFKTQAAHQIQAMFLMIPLQKSMEEIFKPIMTRNGERTVISFTIRSDQFIVSAGKGSAELCGLKTDADLMVFSRNQAGISSCVLHNGSLVTLGGDKLFQSTSTVEYADVSWSEHGASIETSDCASCSIPQAISNSVVSAKNLAS